MFTVASSEEKTAQRSQRGNDDNNHKESDLTTPSLDARTLRRPFGISRKSAAAVPSYPSQIRDRALGRRWYTRAQIPKFIIDGTRPPRSCLSPEPT